MDEYEQEVISQSGDSGPLRERNPWANGDIEIIQAVEKATEACEHYGRSASLRLSHSLHAHKHPPQPSTEMLQNTPSPLSDVPLVSTPSISQLVVTEVRRQPDFFAIVSHLALFGILGVLIRYGLAVLFDDVLSVTQDGTALYRDLPANVVGSFFMGWVGIVYKRDLVALSEPMAIGLSTGLMGSITTYAGWNQKMVALVTTGKLASALSGLFVGMVVAQMSLQIGIHSAKGSKKLTWLQSVNDLWLPPSNFHLCRVMGTFAFAAACCLLAAAAILLAKGRSSQELRVLWLACLVAPPGVWLRWVLARLNGGGLSGHHRWLPVGTLLANLIAASLEAVFSLLQFVVTDPTGTMFLGALQLGFLGCLSTVSTFVAEVYSMAMVGPMVKKAYIYSSMTLFLGLMLGVLLFSVPAWVKGYVKY